MKVLVVGDYMIDKYIWGDTERVSPEAPVVIVKVKDKTQSVGGAGNVLKNLESLGCDTRLFYSDKEIYKTRVFSKGQQIIRIDEEDTFDSSYTKQDLEALKNNSEWADWIIVSDYAKGTVTNEVWNILNPFKGKIIVDPKPINKQFYKGVYLIKPNETEIVEMTREKDIEKAGLKLSKELDTKVLITRGRRGATLIDKKVFIYPVESNEVGNVIGAGDTFIAVLVYCLDKGLDYAIKQANKAASKTVSKLGTYVIKREDLI